MKYWIISPTINPEGWQPTLYINDTLTLTLSIRSSYYQAIRDMFRYIRNRNKERSYDRQ